MPGAECVSEPAIQRRHAGTREEALLHVAGRETAGALPRGLDNQAEQWTGVIRRCAASGGSCPCCPESIDQPERVRRSANGGAIGHQNMAGLVSDASRSPGAALPSAVRTTMAMKFEASGATRHVSSVNSAAGQNLVSEREDPSERQADQIAQLVTGTYPDHGTKRPDAPIFQNVIIHTDASSAVAARSLGASAFTIGSHIYFDTGRFNPGNREGDRLLAHELTHVLQDSEGRVAAGTVLRYEPAPVPVRPPIRVPVRPQVRPTAPPPTRPPGGTSVEPQSESPREEMTEPQAGAPDPGSWEWLERTLQQLGEEANQATVQFYLELPQATTDRGGKAADQFLEKRPRTHADIATTGVGGKMRYYYTPTVFHMLDALEDDIAKAGSGDDVLEIYLHYFPESIARLSPPTGAQISGVRYRPWPSRVGGGIGLHPEIADRDGSARTAVFLNAARKRTDADTALDMSFRAIIKGLNQFEARQEASEEERWRRRKGPCREREINRGGGDPDHNAYATFVSGSDKDFEVTAPADLDPDRPQTGIEVPHRMAYDGRDTKNANIVWEVKTRHEWASSPDIGGAIFSPYIQERIVRAEEQLARGRAVARRCGYEYRWAFENADAADFARKKWGHLIRVEHRARP
jgi:hypothetical protein